MAWDKGRDWGQIFDPIDRHLDRIPYIPNLSTVFPAAASISAGVAAVTLTVSAAVTFLSPKNEIPVIGDVGRTVFKYTPLGVGHVPGISLLPEIYFSHMEGSDEYRLKILNSSSEEIQKMDEFEREAAVAYRAYWNESLEKLRASERSLEEAKQSADNARRASALTEAYQSLGRGDDKRPPPQSAPRSDELSRQPR